MPLVIHPSLAGRLISSSAFLKHAAFVGTPFDKLVVGVAILQPGYPATVPLRILLVQRALSENIYPGFYELPGGHVEDFDDTILDALVREAKEETGLTVTNIVGEIPPFKYSIEKCTPLKDCSTTTTTVKTTIQLNFVAQAESSNSTNGLEITLNPEEHQHYAWVSKEDFEQYSMTPAMKEVVENALLWAEQNVERMNLTSNYR